MSTDHDGSWLPGDDPLDRRDLLVRAGGVGAALALGGLAGASRATAGPTQNVGKVTAFFGQFGAIAEQEGIRKYVFKGFRGDVDPVFVPITAPTSFIDRVRAEAKAGKGNIDLLIGLHGDMVTFQNEGLIRPINDVAKQVKTLPPALVKIGKLGTQNQFYLPHCTGDVRHGRQQGRPQVHAEGRRHQRAHVRAGVTPGPRRSARARGRAGSGCPRAAPASSTASSRASWCPRSRAASSRTSARRRRCAAWTYLRQLWQYTHPQSLTYGFMQDPLLSEEVLLALGSRRAAEDGARPAPGRPRRLPGPEGPEGTRVHAGHRRTGDSEERAEPRGWRRR